MRMILSSLCALILVACSIDTGNCSDVNQEKVYQSYSANYDVKTDTTSTRAQFRFAGATGTTLAMTGKCSITVDSMDLTVFSLLGTSYTGSKSGYIASNAFTFVNNDSKSFVNTVVNQNPIALSSPPTTIGRAVGATIAFTPAVAAGESVSVYVEYAASQMSARSTVALKTASTAGNSSVIFAASDLADLNVDAAVLIYATRTYSKSLDQPSAQQGGGLSYEYKTARSDASLGS